MSQNERNSSLVLTLNEFERRINELSLSLHRANALKGTGTCTFTASALASTTINHNLGVVPVFVGVNPRNSGSLFFNIDYVGTSTLNASIATVNFQHTDGVTTLSGTLNFQWIVHGI